MILEWLEGAALDGVLAQERAADHGGRSLTEALDLLEPAALALGVAHRMGVAHRDVKPANMFVTEVAGERTLKLLDFGIAKVITESESVTKAMAATGASLQAFTPKYGAPEQFTRRYGATGPWTDVFALALVLVEVVSGKDSLEGDDTGQLFVSSVDETARPTLRARGVVVSDEVERVLARALSVDPRSRYSDASSFWLALRAAAGSTEALAASETVLAPTPPPSLGATVPSGPSTTGAQVASIPQPPVIATRRSRGPSILALAIGAAAVLGLAVLAVVGWRSLRRDGTAAAPPETIRKASVPAPSASAVAPARMVVVPADTFVMGAPQPKAGQLRAREVTVSRSFSIAAAETSAGDYDRCVAAGACSPRAPGCTPSSRTAATCIDREGAQSFCRWVHGRLPTEAEWALAARETGRLGLKFPRFRGQHDYAAAFSIRERNSNSTGLT